MTEREKLENELTRCLFELANKTKKEANYNPRRFEEMLSESKGVETARHLINASNPSKGYTKLWELKRLDLTVEAYIWDNEKWHSLFTEEELKKCRNRLRDYDYPLREYDHIK